MVFLGFGGLILFVSCCFLFLSSCWFWGAVGWVSSYFWGLGGFPEVWGSSYSFLVSSCLSLQMCHPNHLTLFGPQIMCGLVVLRHVVSIKSSLIMSLVLGGMLPFVQRGRGTMLAKSSRRDAEMLRGL